MTKVSRKGFRDKNGKQVVIVPNVPGATSGNLASLDAEGNLQDSGKKPADFAETNHGHDKVGGQYTHDSTATMAQAGTYKSDDNKAHFNIVLKDDIKAAGGPKVIDVNTENADNFIRALTTPSTTPENDATKLITSKAVYDAIEALKDVEIIDITRSIGSSSVAFLLDSRVLTNIRSIISRHNVPGTYIPVIVRQHNGTVLTGKDALGYMCFERDVTEVDGQDVTEFGVNIYVAGLVLVFQNYTPGEVNVPSEDLTTWEDYDAISPSTVGYHNFLD